MDAQAASTDGRATLYMDDEIHMFGKDVIKKQRGGFKYKKNKTIYFFISYLKWIHLNDHDEVNLLLSLIYSHFPSRNQTFTPLS
jgi:hypothetical protein